MTHELLGQHKPSSEWYTDVDIWQRIYKTFNTENVFDPCPVQGKNGLNIEWKSNFIYINPPTPAQLWAIKALETLQKYQHVSIIYAAFSESVLWQVPELLTYPTVLVRNRISWIDGNFWIECKSLEGYSRINSGSIHYKQIGDKFYKPNPGYMKPAKSPRNYNAFMLLSNKQSIKERFKANFADLGFYGKMQKL